MNKILTIYSILSQKFGSQGWWPIVNEKTGECEYHQNAPKNNREKLEIALGAILAQNTQWNPNVVKALVQLKKENLLDIRKLLKADTKKLGKLIRSSGYYNQKATKLKNFCKYIEHNYKGDISLFFRKDADKLREELLSIRGIGPETADSIILYAAQKPIIVIDAYAKRIISRVGLCPEDVSYEKLQALFQDSLEHNAEIFNEYHALLVEHAKQYCRKQEPLCSACPLLKLCDYGRQK